MVHNRRLSRWPLKHSSSVCGETSSDPVSACKRIIFGVNRVGGVGPHVHGNSFAFDDIVESNAKSISPMPSTEKSDYNGI